MHTNIYFIVLLGVANFEFPISSEPVLGTHRVCATYEVTDSNFLITMIIYNDNLFIIIEQGLPKGQQSCFQFEVQRYGNSHLHHIIPMLVSNCIYFSSFQILLYHHSYC